MFEPNNRTITRLLAARRPGAREGVFSVQAGFLAAPVGTRPVVMKRHSATSSLRAGATTVIHRKRPLVLPTRSQNHRLRALSG